MAQLHYRHAAMNSGKSTMVLQYRHTYAACGRRGLLMTRLDRAGAGIVSSRIGLAADALEFGAATDLLDLVISLPGPPVDHVIVDEAQFLSPEQVDQLAALVDDHDIDVFTFGLLSDFRGLQFPGSARLVVLADIVETLQVYPMCWCGQPARMNARVSGGTMVTDGDTVLVGDMDADVGYVVLCRRHHRAGQPYAPAVESSPTPAADADPAAVATPAAVAARAPAAVAAPAPGFVADQVPEAVADLAAEPVADLAPAAGAVPSPRAATLGVVA